MTTFISRELKNDNHNNNSTSAHINRKNGIAYPLTVYFDGSCHLCRSEIENLAARNVIANLSPAQFNEKRELNLIDCSPVDFDAATKPALPFTREMMMNVIHACDAEGRWISGVDVFIAMYEAADLSFVSRLLAHRLVKPYAARFYPWIVRNRYRLSAFGLHHAMNIFSARAKRDANATKAAKAAKVAAVAALARSQHCKSGGGKDGNLCNPNGTTPSFSTATKTKE